MKKFISQSVLSLFSSVKRSMVLVVLLLGIAGSAYADIWTIRYVENNTTYFLANDLSRVEEIGLNCLWEVTTEEIKDVYENPVQQYTFKPLNGTEYLIVGADNKLALGGTEDTKALFTIPSGGKLTYMNENALTYSAANGWHFVTSGAPAFRYTSFMPTPYEYTVTYTAEDSDDAMAMPVTEVEWPYANRDGQLIVYAMLTRTRGSQYVSIDKRETLGAASTIEWIPAADITPEFTITGDNKVTLGDVYVAEGANDFQLPLTPTADSPFGTTDAAGNHSGITDADGNYVPWTDVLHITLTYEGVAHEKDIPLVRHTFHTEDFREVTDFKWSAPQLMEWKEGTSQDLTLSGNLTVGYHILNHAGVEVDVEDTRTTTNALTVDFSDAAFEVSSSETWLSVTAKVENKATLTATANQTGNRRETILTGTYIYQSHGVEQSVVTREIISQKHQFDDGQKLTHYEGLVYDTGEEGQEITLNERGNQYTHEAHTYIYYAKDLEYTLMPREPSFKGWHRWYDYDTENDLGSVYSSHYITDGIISTTTSEQTQGRYTTNGNPVGTVKVKYANDTEEHTIALDLSNYTDYTTGNAMREPTLSYRQIFHLIPASKRADELAKHTTETKTFLEDYTVIAPTNTDVYLYPEYYYTAQKIILGEYPQSVFGWVYWSTREQTVSTDNADLGYVVRDGSSYKHINNAEWSSGVAHTATSKLGIVSSEKADTVIYTLTATMGNTTYNLCRFTVMYHNLSTVGPVVGGISGFDAETIHNPEKYLLLGELTFDYEKPGQTSYKAYDKPLPWDESTYGYTYFDGERHEYKTNSDGFDVGWGEYQIINTTASTARWLDDLNQHTGTASEGYMLYVDGTEQPGLVAKLGVDANLCAGQKMYCSAWVANPNTTDENWGGDGLPILRFVVEGSSGNDVWDVISEYTSGAIPKNAGDWSQICFEIDMKKDYSKYRVSIYDFAATNDGNDFAIDDICIFASKIPLVAYQASTACTDDEEVTAVIRLDYNNIVDTTLAGHPVYYSVFQEAKHSDAINPVKLHYVNASQTKEGDYSVQAPQAAVDTCGCIRIPKKGYVPNEADIETSLYQLMNKAADPNNKTRTKMAYVHEGSGYALYIVHHAPLEEAYNYSVRLANAAKDLRSADCANRTELPISDAYELILDYKVVSDMTQAVCGNESHTMAMHLNSMSLGTDNKVDTIFGRCKSDWILSGDTLSTTTVMGVPYETIRDIMTRLRRVGTAESPNPNQFAESIEEIVYDEGQNLNYEYYTTIRRLVNGGYLFLSKESLDTYVPKNASVKYLVLPIVGTGYRVDKDGNPLLDTDGKPLELGMCADAKVIKLESKGETEYTLEVGTTPRDELPQALRNRPTVVRTSLADLANGIDLPITRIKNVVISGDVVLTNTNDPDYITADNPSPYFAFYPDKVETEINNYYQNGDIIHLTVQDPLNVPAGMTWKDLHEGHEYTFEMVLEELGAAVVGDTCPAGITEFTLYIVPEYLMWNPRVSTSDWNNDRNWIASDKEGKMTGHPGYVPLDHSNVIIPTQASEEYYPMIDHHDTYIAKDENLNRFDVGYQAAHCNKIYLQGGAKILDQHHLDYDSAFVDLEIQSGRWYIHSPALKNVCLGDIFTPSSPEVADKNPFAPGLFEGDRLYPYAYYHSLFNETTTRIHESGTAKDKTFSATEWTDFVNKMDHYYQPGQGYAVLGYGDESQTGTELLTVRLPKSDYRYYYYRYTGEQSNRYVDVPRSSENYKFAYEFTNDTVMEITLENESNTDYFVFGNPSMAYIDLFKFFDKNNLSTSFYHLDNGDWKAENRLTAESSGEFQYLLPPMRGVMISKANGAEVSNSLTVRLTPEMLTLGTVGNTSTLKKPAREANYLSLLHIIATNSGASTRLVVGEASSASNGYVFDEDSYVMTSGHTTASVVTTPLALYSLNGDRALAIDIRKQLGTVPFSWSFAIDEYKELTDFYFSGIEQFAAPIYLVDSVAKQEYRLYNGLHLRLQNPTSDKPRYYIHYRDNVTDDGEVGIDGNRPSDETGSDLRVSYFNSDKNEVMVSSNAIMRYIAIYDVMGRLVGEARPNNLTSTITLPTGAYIFRVETAKSSTLDKVLVK